MNEVGTTTCPGCGALVSAAPGPTHRYIGAAPGCWTVYCELLARDYGELAMPPEHRFVVDAYAAQHPGNESLQSIRSVALHLIALHLVFERSLPLKKATSALQHHAKRPEFRRLDPPVNRGSVNVLHVHAARDPQKHGELCWTWARSVWDAWAPHHEQIRRWACHGVGASRTNSR